MLRCIVSIGDCLLDVPESAMPLPRELPGTKYSLDQQCQQIFGEEFVHCPNTSDSDICSQLWCQEDGTPQCSTKNGSLPWADGTSCSLNGTCLHGVCMPTQEVMQPLVRLLLFFWKSSGLCHQSKKNYGGLLFATEKLNLLALKHTLAQFSTLSFFAATALVGLV